LLAQRHFKEQPCVDRLLRCSTSYRCRVITALVRPVLLQQPHIATGDNGDCKYSILTYKGRPNIGFVVFCEEGANKVAAASDERPSVQPLCVDKAACRQVAALRTRVRGRRASPSVHP